MTEPIDRVRFAFDAAFGRMCAATTADELTAELSNMLHHHYRASEERRGARPREAHYRDLTDDPLLHASLALIWVRTFDTHDGLVTAQLDGVYSKFYTELFGVLVWTQGFAETVRPDGHGRDRLFSQLLEGRPVLDTLRTAFDTLSGPVG
jgi:hypothetical protein